MAANKRRKPTKHEDTTKQVKRALKTWRSVMKNLDRMSEEELFEALLSEANKPEELRRENVILRLHRRFSARRRERELKEFNIQPEVRQ